MQRRGRAGAAPSAALLRARLGGGARGASGSAPSRVEAPWRPNRGTAGRACAAARPAMIARSMTDADARPAPARRRSPRAGARRSRSSRTTARRAGSSSARSTRTPASAEVVGFTGPARRGQVDADRRADKGAPRGRPHRRRALDRPLLAVHPGRAARRSHPADRALPRPGRLHPLDGQPRRARRPLARRRCRRRCCSTPPAATTCSSRPSASARRRSTSSTTPTRSCSC